MSKRKKESIQTHALKTKGSGNTIVVQSPTTIEWPEEIAKMLKSEGQDTKSSESTQTVTTSHSITLEDGEAVEYTATAGMMKIKDEDADDRHAEVFYVAYIRNTPATETKSKRPITFAFNGGPGSSSVWLHLGAFGPRKVVLDDDGFAPPPPYQLEDNIYTLLDETDLVFIDPISTGLSRAHPHDSADEFHGVDKDVESVAEFIRLFTTLHKRWESPKYLAGESYGTTRAAGLAGHLQRRHGMYLNGLILISSVLNFQTLSFDTGNDLPYIVFLPTYATSARYHKRLSDTYQEMDVATFAEEVEAFTFGAYATALMQGSTLPEPQRASIAHTLAQYTGLPESYILRHDLRIDWDQFVGRLLRDEKRTIGRLDSRFVGIEPWATTQQWLLDPSYSEIQGAYTATWNHYLRDDLQFEDKRIYEIINEKIDRWDFGDRGDNKYLDVSSTLRLAMSQNTNLRVFVANGYYDVATPHAATKYTFSHMRLDPTLESNISMGYYEAGHMLYTHKESQRQFREDLRVFFKKNLT